MTNITLSHLPAKTLEKLNALAQLHGRSLQEEIQHILETVAEAESLPDSETVNLIHERASCMQQQLEQHAQLNSSQQENPVAQSLNLSLALERLNIFKQTISSLGDLTIRQAIEEGRRF